MKNFGWLLLLGTLVMGGLQSPAQAQSSSTFDKQDIIDLQTLDCRTLLMAEDNNREIILVFMHGYMSGKKGDTTVNGPALAAVTDKVVNACINSPDSKLIAVFEQNR